MLQRQEFLYDSTLSELEKIDYKYSNSSVVALPSRFTGQWTPVQKKFIIKLAKQKKIMQGAVNNLQSLNLYSSIN